MTTVTNTTQGIEDREETQCNGAEASDSTLTSLINPESAYAIKSFTDGHRVFLEQTLTHGSELQRAAAAVFLRIAQGVKT